MPAITTNIAANSAVRYLNINSNQETSALSKLSSGSRITSASDDAAGLAISTRISSDVTALQQAATNAAQANAILQTADGGASNISDILARMKSLASESASGTTVDSSRAYIDSEFQQLSSEIDSIAAGTRYSGQSLLDNNSPFNKAVMDNGTPPAQVNDANGNPEFGITVLVGSDAADTIRISLSDLRSTTLFGVKAAVAAVPAGPGGVPPAIPAAAAVTAPKVDTQADATAALAQLDTAINTVSAARASIGALESRFNFSADSIQTQTQNLQAANSAIKDVDVAAEQALLSSAEGKTQAAVSAETAANQMPQYLLKLLG
jgi:flagellin